MIKVLGSVDFKETIEKSEIPVIVDFYADWCMPCKMVAPLLEEISEEEGGRLSVYKVNVDENPELAREFSVMSIPNIVSFKNGKMYKRVVGNQPKKSLLELVD